MTIARSLVGTKRDVRGSAIFNRGDTQVLNVTTLGMLSILKGGHNVKFGGEIRLIRMYTDRLGGTTYTGGQKVPVAIFKIDTNYNLKPFLAEMTNARLPVPAGFTVNITPSAPALDPGDSAIIEQRVSTSRFSTASDSSSERSSV